MRKGIKEALLRVTEIVDHAETGCSQEVHGHDKAGEKFHLGAFPSAAQLYHAFETRRADQENPAEAGRRCQSQTATCHVLPGYSRPGDRDTRSAFRLPSGGNITECERLLPHAGALPHVSD